MTLIDIRARSSRRRAVVFCCAFLSAAAVSLTWVYTRPAEYRAMARLHISPASTVTQPTEAKDTPAMATDAKSFLTEVQVLTSRPLLQDVVDRLRTGGGLPDLGPDPVESAQRMLRAEPVEGTQIVELSAEGPQRDFLPRLVNTVAEAYRQHVADAYKGIATSTYAEVDDEVRALDSKVTAQRAAINAFRDRYDIVSMEHNENDVLANIEGLSQSYTDANERLAKAKGRLQALRISAATGNVGARAKDDPTLADLEQRASALREQWGDLQRRYTPDFLSLDPDAKSLRARLENLEEQLKSQRAVSGRAALADAQQELSAAQAEVDRLRQDVADNQKQAQAFATHLNDYKALRERPRPPRGNASCRTRPIGETAGERARASPASRASGGRRTEPRAMATQLPAGCGNQPGGVVRLRRLRGVVRRIHRRTRPIANGICGAFVGAGTARA